MRSTFLATGLALVSTAIAAPPTFHDAVAADEPILWYRFDEANGTEHAANYGSLGGNFRGRYVNGVALEVPTSGGDTGAGFVAADEQYVESVADAPARMLGNPTFTAETVVYIPSDDQQCPIWAPFLHWGGPATGRSVYFSLTRCARNKVYAGFYNGGLRMQGTIRLDAWNHIVWVRDSAGGKSGQWEGTTVYVNGRPVPLEPDADLPGAPVIDVTATTFRVQRATDFTRHFTGTMDEVVLYDRLLTPAEVVEHYDALRLCPADLDRDGLVGFNDIIAILTKWGPCDPEEPCPEDLDGSGAVDFADLVRVLSAWGPCE